MEVKTKLRLNKKREFLKLSFLFFVMLSCFNGGLTLLSFLYDSVGLKGLGQINIAILYGGFFLSNFFAKFFIGLFEEYRSALALGPLSYSAIMLSGIFTYYCKIEKFTGFCSLEYVRLANYVGAFIVGFIGSTLVWGCQFAFINKITNKKDKQWSFSMFYQIIQFNNVCGNLVN